ncbi:MAG: YgiT-type zinc finger protein [Ignavibacteriae bacterium]|nr:YgiT-type zinc finger protein [Ignavibacteriota bacterium]
MKCEICGVGTRMPSTVSEHFFVDGKWVLVENIPVEVCKHCGEATFSAGTAEHVRRIVQSGERPRTAVETQVYEYS